VPPFGPAFPAQEDHGNCGTVAGVPVERSKPRGIALETPLTIVLGLPGAEAIDSTDWCDVSHLGRSDWKSLPRAGRGWTTLEPGMPHWHDFNEMLVISLCCVLSGGQGAVDMGLYARAKEPFLRGFLKLSNGLPSHDTFSRLFRR